jgi:hypothetical protein
MATIAPELAGALNTLLEGERASVEMEVALASGATEYTEREALTAMGLEDLEACIRLREYLERQQVPVSWRIHAAVYTVLNEVRYDDRLRAFANHQRATGEHAESLLDVDGDLRAILLAIRDTHVRHIVWCGQRADEFAGTRQLDYRSPAGRALLRRPVGGTPGGDGSVEDSFPDVSGEVPPYPPGEEHARRPMPRYPEVPGTGATEALGDEEAGEQLPDTTLE